MCFMLTFVFVVATLAFFAHGLLVQSVVSALMATIALTFFIRKVYLKRRCIFGDDKDCNTQENKKLKEHYRGI